MQWPLAINLTTKTKGMEQYFIEASKVNGAERVKNPSVLEQELLHNGN